MTEPVPVSEAEQQQLVAALQRHLADGRLDLAQFDDRVRQVYAARTRPAAHAALADLPLLPAEPVTRPGRRRHGEAPGVEPHWEATDEVFRDPTTGRVMRVWVDPTNGARHYLER